METVVPILVFPTEEVNSTTPSIKDIFSQKKNKKKTTTTTNKSRR